MAKNCRDGLDDNLGDDDGEEQQSKEAKEGSIQCPSACEEAYDLLTSEPSSHEGA